MNKQYLIFMAMGFELVGIILVFLYLGQYFDAQYKTNGLGIAGGMVIGLVSWFVHLIWQLKKLENDEAHDKDDP